MFKDEDAEKVAAVRRHQHADDVRLQIREKEKDRIHARNAFFEEGIRLDQEAKERQASCLVANTDPLFTKRFTVLLAWNVT